MKIDEPVSLSTGPSDVATAGGAPSADDRLATARAGLARLFADSLVPVEPVHPSTGYRLAAVLVAVGMVLLPLLYVALIGLIGAGVVYYAAKGLALCAGADHLVWLAGIAYVLGLIVGCLVIYALVKPVFVRRRRRTCPRSLAEADEPLLFDLVRHVCRSVGAPAPARIDVDCRINASVHLRRGLGRLADDNLVLTIGLPLAACLSVAQFAGMLAHELGHFTQRGGTRLVYLIACVNNWFARVIYERDSFDTVLARADQRPDALVDWLLWVAELGVRTARRILWLLMKAGEALSCYLLRQGEYDADRYEARVLGSDAFAACQQRVCELSAAQHMAHDDLTNAWRDRHLPDSLPDLIAANVRRLPPEIRDLLQRMALAAETRLLDTHPCDADRIRRAQAERFDGMLADKRPATVVFADFDTLARSVTREHYVRWLGREFRAECLRPVKDLLESDDRQERSVRALDRASQGLLVSLQPLVITAEAWSAPDAAERLDAARTRLVAERARAAEALATLDHSDTAMLLAEVAGSLLRARVPIGPVAFGLTRATPAAAEQQRQEMEQARAHAAAEFEPFVRAAGERLVAAVKLLARDEVAAFASNGPALRGRVTELTRAAIRLGERLPDMERIRRALVTLSVLRGLESTEEVPTTLAVQMRLAASDMRHRLAAVILELRSAAYPFAHSRPNCSIADFLVNGSLPDVDDSAGVFDAAETAMDGFFDVYFRVLGELALAAETVEAALGLTPLPDPPASPSESRCASE